jgi:hypothetical protein
MQLQLRQPTYSSIITICCDFNHNTAYVTHLELGVSTIYDINFIQLIRIIAIAMHACTLKLKIIAILIHSINTFNYNNNILSFMLIRIEPAWL